MSANLGKISITIGGDHIVSNTYERLTIVKDANDIWYISIWDVPTNIPLTNQGYWKLFFDPNTNSQQVAQNAQDIVRLFSDVQGIEDQVANLLPKSGGTITGDLDVNGNLTKGGHDVIDTSQVSVSNYNSAIVKRDSAGTIHVKNVEILDYKNWIPNYIAGFDESSPTILRRFEVHKLGERLSDRHAGWTQVSKINGWTGNLYYAKFKDGTVIVTGAPRNSSGASGWSNRRIGTLPAGFRPGTTIFQGVASNRHNAGGVPRAQITYTGDIYCETIGNYYMYFTFVFKAEN